MTGTPPSPSQIAIELLSKALGAPNRQAVEFIIANDTYNLIPYDRAILWNVSKQKSRITAISGQTALNTFTELYTHLNTLPEQLKDPYTIQFLSSSSFRANEQVWSGYQRQQLSSILWLPIFSRDKLVMGLWLEKWNSQGDPTLDKALISLLSHHLLPGYGVAWNQLHSHFEGRHQGNFSLSTNKLLLIGLAAAMVAGILAIRVPLRIVAPCEIVAKNPAIITAPLKGTIAKINVNPGQQVSPSTQLFEYDDRIYLQELKIAQNELAVTEAALSRALALGVHDKEALDNLGILKLKKDKEQINLELAQQNANQLKVYSPVKGSVILDDPDYWAGKPVRVGEKIMVIADLSQTRVKLWINEFDNIGIDPTRPVWVFLNTAPESSWPAQLDYVATKVTLSGTNIPSFLATADWKDEAALPKIKPGVEGTAILYGEKVSLLYYLIRRPWIVLRYTLGIW